MTPFGIFLGHFLTHIGSNRHDLIMQGIFNSLAAGTFLYIAVTHSSEWLYDGTRRIKPTNYLALLAGLLMMACIALWY